MVRALGIVRKARQAVQDLDLLKVLLSEISHEIAADRFSGESIDSDAIGKFAVEYDSRVSQDVVLRRKSDSGEEVVVSALLSQDVEMSGGESDVDEGLWPREPLMKMKVCVKKHGVSSILQFDCWKIDGSEMIVDDVFLLPSAAMATVEKVYRGPSYETLDDELKFALNRFLWRRGVNEDFSSWLLFYLHRKEQGQYVDWLRKIETCVTPEPELHAE